MQDKRSKCNGVSGREIVPVDSMACNTSTDHAPDQPSDKRRSEQSEETKARKHASAEAICHDSSSEPQHDCHDRRDCAVSDRPPDDKAAQITSIDRNLVAAALWAVDATLPRTRQAGEVVPTPTASE